jgi:phospholipid transport system substrate-binding protein
MPSVRPTRRHLLMLGLALLAPCGALGGARADDAAMAPIVALDAGLQQVMRAGRATPFADRARTLAPLVDAAFDLPLILKNSVGPRWAGLSAAAQADLLDAFTRFTIATWVANFDTFDGERFEILPQTRRVGNDEVVETRIVPASGEPTRLDYVMRRSDGDDGPWKAVDILFNGTISRVAVQRSDFRAMLGNGDATRLIASLRDKAATLAAAKG